MKEGARGGERREGGRRLGVGAMGQIARHLCILGCNVKVGG